MERLRIGDLVDLVISENNWENWGFFFSKVWIGEDQLILIGEDRLVWD